MRGPAGRVGACRQCRAGPPDRPPPQRIAGITAALQRSLEDLLLGGLRASDLDVVRHCLRTYAAIDKTRDAEALVGQVLVKPYLEQVRAPAGRGLPSWGRGRAGPPLLQGLVVRMLTEVAEACAGGPHLGRKYESGRFQVGWVGRDRPQTTAPQPSVGARGRPSAQDRVGRGPRRAQGSASPARRRAGWSEMQAPQRRREAGPLARATVSVGRALPACSSPSPDCAGKVAGPRQFPA